MDDKSTTMDDIGSPLELLGFSSAEAFELLTKDEADFDPLPIIVRVLAAEPDKDHLELSESYGAVTEAYEASEKAIESYVTKTYQGYNDSVGRFSSIYDGFTSARDRLRGTKRLVRECKSLLLNQQRALRELRFKQIKDQEVIKILNKLEMCMNAPRDVAALLSQEGKAFAAAKLLRESLEISFDDVIGRIDAIGPAREELLQMKPTATETLIGKAWDYLKDYRKRSETKRKRSGALLRRDVSAPNHAAWRLQDSDDALEDVVRALAHIQRLDAARKGIKDRVGSQVRYILSHASASFAHVAESGAHPQSYENATASIQGTTHQARLARFLDAFFAECLALLDAHAKFEQLASDAQDESKDGDNAALVVTWQLLQCEAEKAVDAHLYPQSEIHLEHQPAYLRPVCPPSIHLFVFLLERVERFAFEGVRIVWGKRKHEASRATILKYMGSTLEDSFVPAHVADMSSMLARHLSNVSVFETHETDEGKHRVLESAMALQKLLLRLLSIVERIRNVSFGDCISRTLGLDTLQEFADFCFAQIREIASDTFASKMLFQSQNGVADADAASDTMLCELMSSDPVYLTQLSLHGEAAREYDEDTLHEALFDFDAQLRVREAHEWDRVVFRFDDLDRVDASFTSSAGEPNAHIPHFLRLSSDTVALCALRASLEWMVLLLRPGGELAKRARAMNLEWTPATVAFSRASKVCAFIINADLRLRCSCAYAGGARPLQRLLKRNAAVPFAAKNGSLLSYLKTSAETFCLYLQPPTMRYLFHSLSILLPRIVCAQIVCMPAGDRKCNHDIYEHVLTLRQMLSSITKLPVRRLAWFNTVVNLCRMRTFSPASGAFEWKGSKEALSNGEVLFYPNLRKLISEQ